MILYLVGFGITKEVVCVMPEASKDLGHLGLGHRSQMPGTVPGMPGTVTGMPGTVAGMPATVPGLPALTQSNNIDVTSDLGCRIQEFRSQKLTSKYVPRKTQTTIHGGRF